MVKLRDPSASAAADKQLRKDLLQEARRESLTPSAVDLAFPALKPLPASPNAAGVPLSEDLEARIRKDFRVFLTLIWRHLLGVDPNIIQLDMAYWLQHGPSRSIIMAFRGFSKSWITGAYALWLLWCDPQLKVLVVSGSAVRAVATTNWCLQLIMTMPLLAKLKPQRHQRQSGKSFDVGPALPAQSPSFNAAGITGQIVGFRGDVIIPDDVETQQNSLTVDMRKKNAEAVKEFDSILTPNGVIKFLGTPHDADSLYVELAKRGYTTRIWPGLYPTEEQLKAYGDNIAPFITHWLKKNPGLVGTSTMPTRFSNDDLAKRALSLGKSEFSLQFMLDTSLSDRDKYPLKLKDLIAMKLDPEMGPEQVIWGNSKPLNNLPNQGFEGDRFYGPAFEEDRKVTFSKYQIIVGFVDGSGRGSDETALTILGILNGRAFVLYRWSSTDGYGIETLEALAAALVRYRVHTCYVEDNFGDGMLTTLLRPVLDKAWSKANAGVGRHGEPGGTSLEDVKASNQSTKAQRMLGILEPVTQQHRLVFDEAVIEEDFRSIQDREGEETRHRYSLMYQYTHVTRDRDSLHKDDRLDSLAGALAQVAPFLGVDSGEMAEGSEAQKREEELQAWLDEADDINGVPKAPPDHRMAAGRATRR